MQQQGFPQPRNTRVGAPPAIDGGANLATRFGTVVAGGLITAIVASLPAEIRMGDGGSPGRAIEQWVALAAMLMPFGIAAVGMFRRGREGLRLLAGDKAEVLAAGVLWGCVVEAAILCIFGTLLRAKTHHHGLAGVTFAIVALVSGIVTSLLALRGARMLAKLAPKAQRLGLTIAGGFAFLIVMLVALKVSKSEELNTIGGLIDVLALSVCAVIASARPLADVRPYALIGVPFAAVMLLAGIATVHTDPELQVRLVKFAPLQGWLVGVIFK